MLFGCASYAVELTDGIKNAAGEAYRYLRVIASVVAVVALTVYGVMWYMADARQKASLKEKAWVYLIGVILAFGGLALAAWIIGAVMGVIGDHYIPVKGP